ncbi:DUF262 domain-containing protein [Methylomagnum ishizawai]|nr:DUF262 domain-containing protein [Methylomagnum ishizawai]
MPQTKQSPLCDKPVGHISGRFFVPRYQRGYRWDTDNVKRLLDDLWECGGKPYSLQPIVVKPRGQAADESAQEWELIDGQQRLTTLYLIFLYIQRQGWKMNAAPYSICYETRLGSETYLTTLLPEESEACIDYFHLYRAYKCIGDWFKGRGKPLHQEVVASKLHTFLVENVRVIWYEAPDHPEDNERDSAALFARLNIGRIPLTDAELVKALLLSKSDRAKEVAAQWDMIERDLRDPDIWAFVAGTEATGEYQTHIGLLLDALAPLPEDYPRGRKRPAHYTFETLRERIERDWVAFWEQMLDMHALVLGWFREPRLHNKIGFLVASGTDFGELWNWVHREELTKSHFEGELNECIRARIAIRQSNLRDLSYEADYLKLLNILLLMNVETLSRSGQRFPFRRHVGKVWSLEHIHAQNAQGLTKKQQWEAWLREHAKALPALPNTGDLIAGIEALLAVFETADNLGSKFEALSQRVIDQLTHPDYRMTPDDGLHAIDNLALLSRDDNSRLNNAVFEVKRRLVLEIDREGGYIPICTRNVFLKYYTEEDAQQIHFWGRRDREAYYRAIVDLLQPYLTP